MGCGDLAVALDRAIEQERDRERAAREVEERRWRREMKRLEAFDLQIFKYDLMINKVVQLTLINIRFYKHVCIFRLRPMTAASKTHEANSRILGPSRGRRPFNAG
jgi:hypothetical protein